MWTLSVFCVLFCSSVLLPDNNVNINHCQQSELTWLCLGVWPGLIFGLSLSLTRTGPPHRQLQALSFSVFFFLFFLLFCLHVISLISHSDAQRRKIPCSQLPLSIFLPPTLHLFPTLLHEEVQSVAHVQRTLIFFFLLFFFIHLSFYLCNALINQFNWRRLSVSRFI